MTRAVSTLTRPAVETGARVTIRPRWAVVDVLRGVAILAVVAFHTTWDLGDLGLISWRISAHWSGKVIAHSIAASFVFLVGVSLVLAHGQGIRWRSFWRREAQLVLLALVITAATWAYQPREPVTFGILHDIAVVSLVCLLFVRLPAWTVWVAGVVSVALPQLLHIPGRSPWVSWTGLADGTRPALDWQPVLPWIALAFLGIGVMRWILGVGGEVPTVARLRAWRPASAPARWLAVLGRHTLAIYLIHQPVLYGVLWLLAESRA